MYIYFYIYIYTCTYVYMFIFIYIEIDLSLSLYIYIYIERERYLLPPPRRHYIFSPYHLKHQNLSICFFKTAAPPEPCGYVRLDIFRSILIIRIVLNTPDHPKDSNGLNAIYTGTPRQKLLLF